MATKKLKKRKAYTDYTNSAIVRTRNGWTIDQGKARKKKRRAVRRGESR